MNNNSHPRLWALSVPMLACVKLIRSWTSGSFVSLDSKGGKVDREFSDLVGTFIV